jgi:hypothetical protein
MISWGSNAVNSQLVTQPPTSAFFPLTMGAQYRGPGMWPRAGTYQVPPVVPGPASTPYMSPNATGQVSQSFTPSSGGLFHPTQGTIVFAFIALAIGLFGLHYIHWGG